MKWCIGGEKATVLPPCTRPGMRLGHPPRRSHCPGLEDGEPPNARRSGHGAGRSKARPIVPSHRAGNPTHSHLGAYPTVRRLPLLEKRAQPPWRAFIELNVEWCPHQVAVFFIAVQHVRAHLIPSGAVPRRRGQASRRRALGALLMKLPASTRRPPRLATVSEPPRQTAVGLPPLC